MFVATERSRGRGWTGIFPPMEIEGLLHVDGGVTNNVPLDKARELGARSIYLIECVCTERCPRPL